ncbi:unnamed protein product, partial [Owenia fusiformis]
TKPQTTTSTEYPTTTSTTKAPTTTSTEYPTTTSTTKDPTTSTTARTKPSTTRKPMNPLTCKSWAKNVDRTTKCENNSTKIELENGDCCNCSCREGKIYECNRCTCKVTTKKTQKNFITINEERACRFCHCISGKIRNCHKCGCNDTEKNVKKIDRSGDCQQCECQEGEYLGNCSPCQCDTTTEKVKTRVDGGICNECKCMDGTLKDCKACICGGRKGAIFQENGNCIACKCDHGKLKECDVCLAGSKEKRCKQCQNTEVAQTTRKAPIKITARPTETRTAPTSTLGPIRTTKIKAPNRDTKTIPTSAPDDMTDGTTTPDEMTVTKTDPQENIPKGQVVYSPCGIGRNCSMWQAGI